MSLTIDLTGKIVVITGMSSGIGKGVAEMFAVAGANIAGCGLELLHPGDIERIESNGVKCIYRQCDITKEQTISDFIEQVKTVFGRVDILVSNAGRNVFHTVEACSVQEWDFNHALNLQSHWLMAKYCKIAMGELGGVIIVISSNHAYSTIKGCFPYNVAKTALTGLVRSLAIEWGPKIRTVGLAPGFIDTPGNQTYFDSHIDPEKKRETVIASHPVKRIGTAAEIGAWCVFLSSGFSAFASGTTYLLDGGRGAVMQEE